MIRSTLKKLLGTLLGRKTPPPSARPSPPRQPPTRPAKVEEEEEEQGGGHDHGHSHGHSHGGEREEPAPKPVVKEAPPAPKPVVKEVPPAPVEDRAHSHDHGHSHDHAQASEPEPAAEKKATKKAVEVIAEDTPNPNARKFSTSVTVVEKGSLSFSSAEDAEANPLAKAIWACGGVKGIFAVKDFVTVTKDDTADWAKLSPKVVKALKKAL
jgi:hypothetical protein